MALSATDAWNTYSNTDYAQVLPFYVTSKSEMQGGTGENGEGGTPVTVYDWQNGGESALNSYVAQQEAFKQQMKKAPAGMTTGRLPTFRPCRQHGI
jgi:hypothetical protein